MAYQREKPIAEHKVKTLNKLAELIENKRTTLIVSIKNIPSSQFQQIRAKLRGKALIMVPKKSLVQRAIDKIEKGGVKNLREYYKGDCAILFSDIGPFELSGILSKEKTPAKAKTGQIAPEDIEIEAGPTELVPGPAISELSSLGLQVEVKEGKLNIKNNKVIVKQGEKINENAAGIMSKLDIMPFSIGLEPLIAYDNKKDKIFTDIKINSEQVLKELKHIAGRTFAFAYSIGYICKETIKLLLGKANSEVNVLNKLIRTDEKSKQAEETDVKGQENKGISKEKPEEEKEDESAEKKPEKKSEEKSKESKNQTQSENKSKGEEK